MKIERAEDEEQFLIRLGVDPSKARDLVRAGLIKTEIREREVRRKLLHPLERLRQATEKALSEGVGEGAPHPLQAAMLAAVEENADDIELVRSAIDHIRESEASPRRDQTQKPSPLALTTPEKQEQRITRDRSLGKARPSVSTRVPSEADVLDGLQSNSNELRKSTRPFSELKVAAEKARRSYAKNELPQDKSKSFDAIPSHDGLGAQQSTPEGALLAEEKAREEERLISRFDGYMEGVLRRDRPAYDYFLEVMRGGLKQGAYAKKRNISKRELERVRLRVQRYATEFLNRIGRKSEKKMHRMAFEAAVQGMEDE